MIEWWPHQKTGLQKLAMAIAEGETRICVASPTGGGKTQMAKAQLLKLPRSVFYTHREILFDQTSEKFMEDEIPHGLRASGKDSNHDEPVQLAMIQSEYNAAVKGMRRSIHNANQIIIDEAHNNRESMMQALIDAHDCVTIGLTATPLGIGHIYDRLIIAGTNRELRDCGAHCPARHYAPPEPDFLEVSGEVKIGGETGIRKTKRSQFATMVYADVVEHYKRLNPEQKPTLLFAPGVAESIWFAKELSSIGIPSAHIDGEDVWVDGQMYDKSKAKVDEIEQRCKAGEIKIVCNRFVLREGVDWPFIHHGIFATVFGSLTSYLQAGGRIIRNHPSMAFCQIQDHGGNYWRHGSLNLDRGWRLELTNEIAYQIRRERHRTKKDPQPIVCPECFAVRLRGKVCHECKFRYEKRTRPVRYQDGQLKQVAIKEFRPKRYLDDNSKNRKDWESLVWAVRKSKKPSCENRTFSQLAGKIAYDNYGRHPSRDWPMMPVRAIDFYLPVKSVPVHDLIGYKRKTDCEANQ